MNKQLTDIMKKESFAHVSRVFAAIIGGYILSNLMAILLCYLWPGSAADAVMTATVVSYLLYAAIIIWVFSGKTLSQVWRTLIWLSLVCSVFIYLLIPEGIF